MKLRAFLSICILIISEGYAFVGPRFQSPNSEFLPKKTLRKTAHDGYRLPGNARPKSYDVTLNIYQDNWIVGGEVVITLDVDPSNSKETQTKSLQLNAEIEFKTTPTFMWNDKMECAISSFGGEFIEITCPESIEGKDQKLKITYDTAYSSNDQFGLYQVDYKEDGRTQYMAATQLQPDYARRLFPCFDEPEFRAPIKLTIHTDKTNYDWTHLISNMGVASQTVDGNSVTTTFEESPSMSTYMLAFLMTSNFENFTNSDVKTNFEIFARPETEKYLSTALENGPKLIDLMGKYTGITYETMGNPRMVFAAVPESNLPAMGNWGLITFREQNIVDEGTRTTAKDKQTILQLVARELSNQWFGDYVSLDWWSETWLNEGFAEFFEHYLLSQVFADFDMLRQMAVETRQQALKADSYPTAIPLTSNESDINTGDDLQAEFTDISSSKGASIIRLMQYILGENALKTGLQKYLTNNKNKHASTTALLNTLQSVVSSKDKDKVKISKYLNEWIYNSGYPLLDVSLKDNKVTINASKFSSSVIKTEDNTADWWIPLTYTTSKKPDFNTMSFKWTHTSELPKLDIPMAEGNDSWIIFNLQSSGFYRVNYDQTLWERIINVLNNSKTYSTVDVVNRAQLLDDIFNVAKSYQTKEKNGTQYYLTAFKLAEYLKYETEYHPWYTFFTEMQYLMELIQDEDTLVALKNKILDVVSPQLLIPKDDEKLKHTEILRRSLILSWACKLGHENCTRWALEQYQKYKNNTNSIDNNYRHTIICTALSLTNDSSNEFKTITNLMEASSLSMEQADIIKALTCINDEDMVKELLGVTVNYAPSETKFSRMFNPTILSSLSTAGSKKLSSALHFVLENYFYINQYWQGVETADVALKQISAKIYSQTHVDMINSFGTTYENMDDYKAFIQACTEAVKIANENMEYLGQYSDILKSVIEYDGGVIPSPTTPSPPTTTPSPPTTTPSPPTTTPKGGSNMIRCNILLTIVVALLFKYLF